MTKDILKERAKSIALLCRAVAAEEKLAIAVKCLHDIEEMNLADKGFYSWSMVYEALEKIENHPYKSETT